MYFCIYAAYITQYIGRNYYLLYMYTVYVLVNNKLKTLLTSETQYLHVPTYVAGSHWLCSPTIHFCSYWLFHSNCP